MIHIKHNGQIVYIGQRINMVAALQLLRAAGIDPEYIRKIMPSEYAEMREVKTVTIDEAIEVLK